MLFARERLTCPALSFDLAFVGASAAATPSGSAAALLSGGIGKLHKILLQGRCGIIAATTATPQEAQAPAGRRL